MVADIESLLEVPRVEHLFLELTSRCNLKCKYCAVSGPTYKGEDLVDFNSPQMIQSIHRLGLSSIQLNGHGETTIVDDWHRFARSLCGGRVPVVMTTNLCKQYTDEEIDVLARFSGLSISCDTHDAKTFKMIRRGGDLRQLVYNLLRIRTSALRQNHQAPFIAWNCVMNDRVVLDFPEYCRFAALNHVGRLVLCNLVIYPWSELRHVSDLNGEDLRQAIDALNDGISFWRGLNREFVMMGGLPEQLNEAIKREGIDATLHY